MAKKRTVVTDQDKINLQPYLDVGVELLRETPVMRLVEFEEAIKKELFATMSKTELNGMADGRNRLRWQNMVDWVKARLTQNGATHYVDIGEERYIVYLVSIGYVDGFDHICRYVDALKIIKQLTAAIKLGDSIKAFNKAESVMS